MHRWATSSVTTISSLQIQANRNCVMTFTITHAYHYA
jgi:hypothetical protein